MNKDNLEYGFPRFVVKKRSRSKSRVSGLDSSMSEDMQDHSLNLKQTVPAQQPVQFSAQTMPQINRLEAPLSTDGLNGQAKYTGHPNNNYTNQETKPVQISSNSKFKSFLELDPKVEEKLIKLFPQSPKEEAKLTKKDQTIKFQSDAPRSIQNLKETLPQPTKPAESPKTVLPKTVEPQQSVNTSHKEYTSTSHTEKPLMPQRPLQHSIEPLKDDLSMLPDTIEMSYASLPKSVPKNQKQQSRKVSTGSDKPFVENDESVRQPEKGVRYLEEEEEIQLSRDTGLRERSKLLLEERRTQTSASIVKSKDRIKESMLDKSIMDNVANKSNIELFSNVVTGYCDNISMSVRRKLMSAGQSIDEQRELHRIRKDLQNSGMDQSHHSMVEIEEEIIKRDRQNILTVISFILVIVLLIVLVIR